MHLPRTTSEEAYEMAYRELLAGRLYAAYLTRTEAAEFLEQQMRSHLTEEVRTAIRRKVDIELMIG